MAKCYEGIVAMKVKFKVLNFHELLQAFIIEGITQFDY